MKKTILATLLSFIPALSFAGSTTATINGILVVDGAMLVYVYPTGGVANAPGCHGANGDYYSFSMSRPMGKEYLALLTAAWARGTSVTFWGKGACVDQAVSETLDYFRVEP